MRQGFLRSGLWEWEVSGESENERTRERASERARETEAEEGDEREHSTETWAARMSKERADDCLLVWGVLLKGVRLSKGVGAPSEGVLLVKG